MRERASDERGVEKECRIDIHQVVNRHASDPPNPGLHVADADVEVLADALLGDLAGHVHVEQVVLADLHVLAAHEHLVRRRHVLVEDLGGDRRQGGVGNPRSKIRENVSLTNSPRCKREKKREEKKSYPS